MSGSPHLEGGDEARLDMWLFRARLFKTRSYAARFIDRGGVRLTRGAVQTRVDKPSRQVRPGDRLVFALGGRITDIEITALGERRGPAVEARRLYVHLDQALTAPDGGEGYGVDKPPHRLEKSRARLQDDRETFE